jgi:hypothetical protein
MSRLGVAAAALALAACAAAAGCGFGEGETTQGEATLTVTHEYGADPVLEASVSDPPESETVIRFLDREAEITTRFGGGFVHSIDGVAGEIADGRTRDWFFFVNGVESSTGAAEVTVRGGDRVWWDYRDWTDALRTPAVVGSWPEPFAQASAGADGAPVIVECAGERAPCDLVAERLAEEGVDASIASLGEASADEALRLLVGDWEELRGDPLAGQLARDPATSGVFARFRAAAAETELVALDGRADEAAELGSGAGLVAGLRRGDDPPAWVVTGTDAEGVEAAAGLLDDETLADRYALAVADGTELPLPAPSEE